MQEMWVVAAAIVSAIGGRGKSRLAQAEMPGVFVPGASQGSEVLSLADGVERALSEARVR
ncbi:2-phospho-L-lactate guanylyltransferase [Brevibacillus sp. IT-7CA2]